MADPMIVWYVVVSVLLITILVHSLRHLHSLRARRVPHKVAVRVVQTPHPHHLHRHIIEMAKDKDIFYVPGDATYTPNAQDLDDPENDADE